MPLPDDYVIKAGKYQRDSDGSVFHFCSCPGSPWQLSRLRGERNLWSVWPPLKPADAAVQEQSNAG